MPAPVRTDGKFFAVDGRRFPFRGVTYGTFRPRDSDGARFPVREVIQRDLAAMRDAGFTVVRTYTAPPEDLLEVADTSGLRVLAGVFYPDWRYLVGRSRRELRGVQQAARKEVRQSVSRLHGDPRVLALALGNEVPADVLRWFGTSRVAGVLSDLVEQVRAGDADRLVTYANYPTAEYLPLDDLDFLMFNVFLEHRADFRKYLTRLHHLARERPLVLGEVGLHAPDGAEGEQAQAASLSWQLEAALERGVAGTCTFTWTDEWWVGDAAVEGWRFGLTRADRSPRPALTSAAEANRRTVADLLPEWPTITVVICAYNASPTLDECLRHTTSLDYPGLEILVVDDGSTDDTAAIARRHPRVTLVPIQHAGLSVARNEGFRAASGKIVAYLDSDAYPTPDWPYYLALGFDERQVVGAGGPNVPPPDDPVAAQVVARSPGGPVHVLLSDDRAEHIPGCNMAFYKLELENVGGCDPVYDAAGDDVDLCWKMLDAGGEIGFHPAALVWHHRRPGLRPYLRQQRGYGRAEALVEARHPDRFTPLGSARWRGRIYNSLLPVRGRQRVYRGPFGSAAYQSVYQGGGYAVDIAHQVGVPAAVAALLALPLVPLAPALAVLPALALLALVALGAVDVVRASPPRSLRSGRLRFRLAVAVHHLLQPLVRLWGRRLALNGARSGFAGAGEAPPSATTARGGVLLLADDRPRAELAAQLIRALRRSGVRTHPASEWSDHDATLAGSWLLSGELVTSSHPPGTVQLRVRRRVAWTRVALVLALLVVLLAFGQVALPIAVAGLALGDLARGWWQVGPRVRRALTRGGPVPCTELHTG